MATFVKFEPFIQFLVNKEMDLFGTNETINVIIHSDAPVVATDDTVADLTQITGTGYAAADTQNDATRSGGTVTMTMVDYTWTAGAGDWTAGRYVAMYDDTPTTPTADPLFGDYDYGASFTVGNGETFTVDYGASVATFA